MDLKDLTKNSKRLEEFLKERTGKDVMIVKQGTCIIAVWPKENKLNSFNFEYASIYAIEESQIKKAIKKIKE